MKKYLIPIIILLFVGGVTAGIIVNRTEKREKRKELISWVDRGLSEDDKTRVEAKITEITDKIGGDRDAHDLNLWLDLGNWKSILGDLAGARDAFRTATDLNQFSHLSQYDLGVVLEEMNDLAGAEKAYLKALELDAQEQYFVKYADFLEEHYPERTADYENLLQGAVQKLGQKSWIIARLATFYEAQGRLEEAKSHLEVLIRLEPDDASIKKDLERVEKKITEASPL